MVVSVLGAFLGCRRRIVGIADFGLGTARSGTTRLRSRADPIEIVPAAAKSTRSQVADTADRRAVADDAVTEGPMRRSAADGSVAGAATMPAAVSATVPTATACEDGWSRQQHDQQTDNRRSDHDCLFNQPGPLRLYGQWVW